MSNDITAMANKNKKNAKKPMYIIAIWNNKTQLKVSSDLSMVLTKFICIFFYSMSIGFFSTVERHPLLLHALANKGEIIEQKAKSPRTLMMVNKFPLLLIF